MSYELIELPEGWVLTIPGLEIPENRNEQTQK